MPVNYKLPETVSLELTYNCNHKCIFCSCPWEAIEDYRKPELTFDEWKKVINTVIDSGVKSITLTGGDPLTRLEIRELIKYIASLNVQIVLITNGRLMDEEFLEFISHFRVSLCVSVPGIDSFYELTGVDNVNNVLVIFEKAKKFGISTTANITVTKKNLPELYENIALPLIHGADYILLNRFLPGGRGLSNTEYLMTVEETNEMLDIAEEVLVKANKYGHIGTELPLCAIKNAGKYKHLRISTMCSAAKGFFVIDPSGYIKVCNHSPIRVCHYSEIDNLFEKQYWQSFYMRDYLPQMCMGCDSNAECDGGCREAAHVYLGKITDPDPVFEKSSM